MRRFALLLLLAPLLLATGCDLGEIEHAGTVTRVEQDGGFWGIVTADGERFRPNNLPAEFEHEGMEVEFEGYVLDDERADDEWGIPVRLTEVEVPIEPVNK